MKFFQRESLLALITSLLVFASPAKATCELVPFKQQNFAGLELIRACSILPIPEICSNPENPIPPLNEPAEPLVDLVAENMLYFNWEIPAQNVVLIEDILGLADKGFNIVPIEIIGGEKPKYYLSLNFYSVVIAGVVNVRSEWSIYVATADDPKPRYMVVEVLSSEDAADPTYFGVEIPPPQWFLRPGTEVNYLINDTDVEVSNPDFFAAFSLQPGRGQDNASPPGSGKYVEVGQPWAEANDVLYYTNGIADTALYNSNLTQAKLLSINPNKVQVNNNSPWSGFIGEKPDHVLLYRQPLKLAFTPYFNLYDPGLGLDPGYLGALQAFKSITFGGFSYGHAFQVLFGQAEPLLRFNVPNNRVPSIFVNFNIPRKNARVLESMLDLPPGFKLARSRMTQGRPEQYLLSLNIYETINVLTGQPENRAEWSVYVEDENDPTANRPYLMVVDVKSSALSLDPVNLFTPPVPFTYGLTEGLVVASIDADYLGADYFDIEFSMPDQTAPSVPLQLDWILSNDRVYWGNGVYDKLLYNGLLLDADVADADLGSVVIDDNSMWSGFVDPEPVQLAVFRNPLRFVVRPWYNVEELCPVP